eukprot:COSAG02_NODE_46602_length_347_cov_1.080645_1_plen_40_part_10
MAQYPPKHIYLCYIQDPGCFMEGFIEKRQADIRETIASQT